MAHRIIPYTRFSHPDNCGCALQKMDRPKLLSYTLYCGNRLACAISFDPEKDRVAVEQVLTLRAQTLDGDRATVHVYSVEISVASGRSACYTTAAHVGPEQLCKAILDGRDPAEELPSFVVPDWAAEISQSVVADTEVDPSSVTN